MTDYKALGFRCGLEIHQQLTGKKLFCDCDAINSTKKPNVRIERQLRAVAGETGHVDAAAKHEMQKGKSYVYVANTEDTCLVELDEEPPHLMNEEHIKTAVQVAVLMNAKVVDEIRIMRKTVVDGSNVSGFQRTALIGYDGYIETSLGKVRVPSICLEEEAAQKLEADKDSITYRLDRLGIALLEIATETDILNPEHAKETAEKLGMILRSTGKAKRGLGTIRQDVNISIKGGARTEVKGFQDLKSIPKVVEAEIKRQAKLIKKGKKLKQEVRKAEPDFSTTFLRPMPGAARMYPETDVPPVKPTLEEIEDTELLDEKAKRFEHEYNLSKDLAMKCVKSEQVDIFEKFLKTYKKIKPAFLAEVMISYPKEIKRDHAPCNPEKIETWHFESIFEALNSGEIAKGSVMQILIDIAKGKTMDLTAHKTVSLDEIEPEIIKLIKKNKGAPMGAIMGMVMKKFNNVDGRKVNELVRKHM